MRVEDEGRVESIVFLETASGLAKFHELYSRNLGRGRDFFLLSALSGGYEGRGGWYILAWTNVSVILVRRSI